MTKSDLIMCLVIGALFLLETLHRALFYPRPRPPRLDANDSSPEDAAYIKRDAWHHPEDI